MNRNTSGGERRKKEEGKITFIFVSFLSLSLNIDCFLASLLIHSKMDFFPDSLANASYKDFTPMSFKTKTQERNNPLLFGGGVEFQSWSLFFYYSKNRL